MFALILAEYAPEPVDILKVIKMALVHDLVEIDAGDTFLYDESGNADKAEREAKAADRIFALLPAEQGAEIRALWEEFEAKETPEAKFAARWTASNPFCTIAILRDAPGESTESQPTVSCKATATSQSARQFYGIAYKNWLMKWSMKDILILGIESEVMNKPIKTEADYKVALACADEIFDAKPGTSEGEELVAEGYIDPGK